MRKTETIAAVVKAAYVRPRIACFTAASEYSLCAGSPIGGEHEPALPGGDLEEDDQP